MIFLVTGAGNASWALVASHSSSSGPLRTNFPADGADIREDLRHLREKKLNLNFKQKQ